MPSAPTVMYTAGWNLIGGPSGTVPTGAAGPLYTYLSNDGSYETVPAGYTLQGAVGYWVFFPVPATVTL